MAERPRPDIEHTREALRRHDERPDDEPAGEDAAPDERDEGDEEEPEAGR
jgi:hypothetical protein